MKKTKCLETVYSGTEFSLSLVNNLELIYFKIIILTAEKLEKDIWVTYLSTTNKFFFPFSLSQMGA